MPVCTPKLRRAKGEIVSFDSAFFLFCFFPLVFVIYALVRNERARNVLLLAAGLAFYSLGRLFDLLLVLLLAGLTYALGRLMARGRGAKAAAIAAVVLNLGVLAFFKTVEIFTVRLAGSDFWTKLLFASPAPAALTAPLGISFFTFKCVSYTVDTYKDPKNAAGSFGKFLLYATFFPEIVSGPLSRYREFAPQLTGRRVTVERAAEGFCRFIRGLAKKLFLAGAAGAVADAVFSYAGPADMRLAWAGAVCFTLQLFFDFSGYSDMAIGLAGAFGFTSPENFNYPYAAVSITDFWRRWHMSLSGWFRDYVYIPLGGNRKGRLRTALNKFAVFALCGLWHGFGLTYLLWGVWHGLLAGLESLKVLDVPRWRGSRMGAAAGRVYTLLAVLLGFVMFRAGSAGQGFSLIGALFTGFSFTPAGTALLLRAFDGRTVFLLVLGVLFCFPWMDKLSWRRDAGWFRAVRLGVYAALFALCLTELAAGGFTPFIYARF